MNNDEIVNRLNRIINDTTNVDTAMRLRNLRNELEPRPEFLTGEFVMVRDDNKDKWEFNVLKDIDFNVLHPYRCSEFRWKQCKRIEKLPIHFIEWSGGDRPCSGLVVVKLRGDSNNAYPLYDVRRGECLTWNHHGDITDIIGYHQIEDLEDENRKHLKHSIRGGE